MPEGIEVLECSAQEECERFWRGLREYFERDIFPGEENCYHCSEEYKKNIETLHARRFNPAKYLFFRRTGDRPGAHGHLRHGGRQAVHTGVLRLP